MRPEAPFTHNILSKFSEDEILAQLRKLQVLGENGDISAIRVFLSYFLCSADKLMEVKNIPDIQLTDEKALAIRKIIES
ncbi:hypothetical protein [Caedibacter taeniospiralis]|nr:hypothetical protein [Caedibacter taeniospiralis]